MGKMLGTCPAHIWQEVEDKYKKMGLDVWAQMEEDAGFTTETAREFFDMILLLTKSNRTKLIKAMKIGRVSTVWLEELEKVIAEL